MDVKAEGAFLSFAAGDALGWPQKFGGTGRARAAEPAPHVEFRTWTRRRGGRHRPFDEVVGAGEYSDDTQLLLAVARCRTTYGADWWKAFATVELPLWTLYERDGGGATKRAARAWIDGCPPWKAAEPDLVRRYFDAGGNGAAMRVLPHALFLARLDNPGDLVRDVVLDGLATHGHPRALVGAAAYAYAAWSLVRRTRTLGYGELLDLLLDESAAWGTFPQPDRGGGTWLAAADRVSGGYGRFWTRTVDEMRALLETARRGVRAGALADDHAVLAELGCFGSAKSAGTVTAAGAAYLASRHAAQPAQSVLRAAFESGADTDTLAAMTGGLLGCLAGLEWMPRPWFDVQDAGYLRRMAGRVTAGPTGAERLTVPPRPDPRVVRSELARNEAGDIVLCGGMRARAQALADPKPLTEPAAVRRWRLVTAEGQTLYVTTDDCSPRELRRDPPADAPTPVQGALAVRCEPEPNEVSGLTYVPDFLGEREETDLVGAIDQAEWISDLQRRVQHYGWRYDYRARQVDASMRLGPLPEWAARLARKLASKRLLTELPDQVIVNEYVGDQGISRHVDAETSFADGIATISLLESWEMVFRERGRQGGRKVEQRLDRRSAAIMTGDARYRWTHEIPKRKNEPGRIPRGRRLSLTFRKVLAPADADRAKAGSLSFDRRRRTEPETTHAR